MILFISDWGFCVFVEQLLQRNLALCDWRRHWQETRNDFHIIFCLKTDEKSVALKRPVLHSASFLWLNGANYGTRGVPSIMSFCCMKIVGLVSELLKIKWEREWKMGSLMALTALMKSRGSLHPVRLLTESFLRNWTCLILIISLIHHQRADEMTRAGPPNLPRRRTVPQEDGDVRLLK